MYCMVICIANTISGTLKNDTINIISIELVTTV